MASSDLCFDILVIDVDTRTKTPTEQILKPHQMLRPRSHEDDALNLKPLDL